MKRSHLTLYNTALWSLLIGSPLTAHAECYPPAPGAPSVSPPDCVSVNAYLNSSGQAVPASASNPFPVSGTVSVSGFVTTAIAPSGAPTINSSAVIGTGATFQVALASGATRKSLQVANNNTNGDNCWMFLGSGTATSGVSILLTPGGSASWLGLTPPTDEVQVTCATTGDVLYVSTQ